MLTPYPSDASDQGMSLQDAMKAIKARSNKMPGADVSKLIYYTYFQLLTHAVLGRKEGLGNFTG